MHAADPALPPPRMPGMAALARLCLGFVGGWWLLQLALLGAGSLALERVQAQMAEERLHALGAVLRVALAGDAAARFDGQAAALLAADPTLAAIVLLDGNGEEIRRAGAGAGPLPPGTVQVGLDRGMAALVPAPAGPGWRHGVPLLAAAAALPLLHLAAALALRRRLAARRALPWMLVNGATGMLTSVLLLAGLLVQAHDTATTTAQAMDRSLALSVRDHLARPTPDPHQLDRLLADYRGLDPRLHRIDLPVDGAQAPVVWRHGLTVAATPALVRGLKNLAVLVVATALLCAVLAGTTPGFKPPLAGLGRHGADGPPASDAVLAAVRPLYFLAVFAENLCAPFLPRLLHDAVTQAHLPPHWASALFMAYFLAFTAVLIPGGALSARFGAGGLVRGGAALLAAGLALPALSLAPPALAAARLLAGAGQGVLLIGVQSLILAHTTADRRTAGTGIIVFGFNGGMVAGNAFGSLLVDRFGPAAVFALAGAIAALVTAAALLLLAGIRAAGDAPGHGGRGPDAVGLRCLLDPGYLLTTLCIGIPTKAVLTGVVLFALPLILGRHGFTLEEIGQIAMVYAAGVLMATALVARLPARRRRTGQVLTVGALVSALGLAALGLADRLGPLPGGGLAALLTGCILLLGLAHGCINAPVVAHVADLPVARRLGPVRVAASYRLVERLGHMGGPLVVERCLTAGGSAALAAIAAVAAAAALVFLAHHARRRE